MLFLQAAEVEVGEDVAEEDEAAEECLFEDARGVAGAGNFCAEVQVRQDERVVDRQVHASFLVHSCYGMMKEGPPGGAKVLRR